MSKMDPKMGAQTWSFFNHLAPFFCARRPWEPKWLPSLPQEPPRPVQASISIDFWLILDEFLDDFLHHVGYFLSGLRVGGIGRQASTIKYVSKMFLSFYFPEACLYV